MNEYRETLIGTCLVRCNGLVFRDVYDVYVAVCVRDAANYWQYPGPSIPPPPLKDVLLRKTLLTFVLKLWTGIPA